MRHKGWLFTALMILVSIAYAPNLSAQCQSRVLVSAVSDDGESSFAVSIATLDYHCLTGGSFNVQTSPPGAVMFENGIDSFFDVFTEISTDDYVRKIGLTPTLPPGVLFDVVTDVVYDDPWYPPQVVVETCWINPGTMIFEAFVPAPIPDSVPPLMVMGQSACFKVVHKVYKIPLANPGSGMFPAIIVTPGCGPGDICIDDPACTPGGEFDYRWDVYQDDNQWYLEFEYSNASIQPVCYCVTYVGGWPIQWKYGWLVGLDAREQTVTVSTSPLNGAISCGTVDLFSYPPGAEIGPLPNGGAFEGNVEREVIGEVQVSRGTFQAGDEFSIVAYVDYAEPCADLPSEWIIERVHVTPDGTLEVVDEGGECPQALVSVPSFMDFGQAECITVCHDVYYIQLNTPPEMMPVISVQPGCDLPCENPGCTPGELENCCYWLERIGTHWYLRFEYSNPDLEPVCYCISYYDLTPSGTEGYVLAAFDETAQALRVSLWGSSPETPLAGTLEVGAEPQCTPDNWYWVESFFDVFTDTRTWELPFWQSCRQEGEAFQLVATVTFDDPGVDPISYREWIIENSDGTYSPYTGPTDPPCISNVPSQLLEGQGACFTVCHDIFEIPLVGTSGRPIIEVVPGCGPDCPEIQDCMPGAPTDYQWWLTESATGWTLHFEYSNSFVQPVCYCVTFVGSEPECDPHVLACWDEWTQDLDVSIAITSAMGEVCEANGTINIYVMPPEAAVIGPYPTEFAGVGSEWFHFPVAIDPQPTVPESFFDIFIEVDFSSPSLPPIVYREPVHTFGLPPDIWTENVDEGGECMYTSIPPYGMSPSMSWCFIVCHDVYHIPVYSQTEPRILVTPGCYGAPLDNCEPTECTPGGLWDYRYDVYWDIFSETWVLEFEYSNQNIEPVCYCVSVLAPLCLPVDDLTILYFDDPTAQPYIQLTWTAPQSGIYDIYSTELTNYSTMPPSSEWTLEESLWIPDDGLQSWTQALGESEFKFYAIVVNCSPPSR